MADADLIEPHINAGCRLAGVLPNGRVVLEWEDPNPL